MPLRTRRLLESAPRRRWEQPAVWVSMRRENDEHPIPPSSINGALSPRPLGQDIPAPDYALSPISILGKATEAALKAALQLFGGRGLEQSAPPSQQTTQNAISQAACYGSTTFIAGIAYRGAGADPETASAKSPLVFVAVARVTKPVSPEHSLFAWRLNSWARGPI